MLENPRAPRVRTIAKLANKNARTDTGTFLLEGPQAVSEALQWRPELLLELFATPTALERHPEIGELAASNGIDIEFATEDVIDSMSDTVTPQGVAAVCRQFPTSIRDIFVDQPKLVVVLEEVRDPGNLGTIIRAADAAGADAVVLSGRAVDLYNPKVVRSTTGSLFHLPVAVGATLADVLVRARAAGLQTVAADVKGEDLRSVARAGGLAEPTLWVFGNEARGLEDDDLAKVERIVAVPNYGKAESMNIATAASVCLYETAFAQRD
jgi:TrmH family RNA methyltransferase